MEPQLQYILVFILALLTLGLLSVGVYLILVLKELRETIKRTTMVIDNIYKVSNAVSNPINSVASLITTVVESINSLKNLKNIYSRKEK